MRRRRVVCRTGLRRAPLRRVRVVTFPGMGYGHGALRTAGIAHVEQQPIAFTDHTGYRAARSASWLLAVLSTHVLFLPNAGSTRQRRPFEDSSARGRR